METPARPTRELLARRPFLPLLMLIPLACLVAACGLDEWLADALYAAQGYQWALRDHPLTEALLHNGGRDLSLALWLVLGITWLASLRTRASGERRPLGYLLATALISTLLVSTIKHFTHMDCPWDLLRYGGDRPFVGLLQWRPEGMGKGVCWPAGHASSGYCWLGVYYYFLAVSPRWRWPALFLVLILGATFGFSQQLRGAHFLSHDLWTISICWSVAAIGYRSSLKVPSRAASGKTAPVHVARVRTSD